MDSLYNWNDLTKIGVALTGFGCFFTFLGVMMFLDTAMLTLGNALFVAGVALVMGKDRCMSFFLERSRWRGSACFFLGVLLVMTGWCFIGLLIEGFGFLNLFGNFFPMVVRVLEMAPFVGGIFRNPHVQRLLAAVGLATPQRGV